MLLFFLVTEITPLPVHAEEEIHETAVRLLQTEAETETKIETNLRRRKI